MENTVLYVVVPCYNEEEVLPETTKRLAQKLEALVQIGKISEKSRVLYVDDGSKDKTWRMIADYHTNGKFISGLKLSRNRGHQNALFAGLMTAKEYCDCAVSIDADLQDDINIIDGFLENFEKGCDIVYGVRSSRETDTFFKRKTAESFYKLMRYMGAETVFNHADCRLMSKRALDALADFREINLFLRGMVPLLGFKFATVEYARDKRFAGESKYPFKKMLGLAIDGITSFSTKPLKFITYLGVLICVMSVISFVYVLVSYFFGRVVGGWASLMVSLWFLDGVLLIAIGILGAYVGKIYTEVKARPRYIIDLFLND
ncbi:MAG: glycosyltransferase family 2 protein [Oscillospiraceae bacterium]|nr:glycosyltransferase family 2 protein [Oscillospiraceae bacterium]